MKTYLSKVLTIGLLLALCVNALPAFAAPDPPGEFAPALNPPHLLTEVHTAPAPVGTAPLAVTAPTTEWTLHKTADNAHPDGNEQQTVWLMNRARANPTQEGIWLATSTDPDIAGGRTYFGVDITMLQNEFAGYAAKPPAAFDARLYNAAKAHSDDLIARDAQDHDGQFARVTAAGFVYAGARGNVFSYADNSLNAHAAWNIDWGPGGTGGMQAGRGHRQAIMSLDGDYTNVGLALVYENNPNTQVGPYVSTGNYCHADTAADHYNRFIVGTVWEDQDEDNFYDPGEGLGGVTVMPDTGTYYAITADSGGYAIPITAPGAYVVTFSGAASAVKSVTVGDVSVLLDLVTTPAAVPDAPTNLAVALTAQTVITLTWTDNSNDENGFKIERSLDGSSGWMQVGTVVMDVTTYADTGLTCETPYYYRVRAYNATGDSAYSNVANGTTTACPVLPPTAPTNLSVALVSQTAITLTWTDASDNETGFRLERSPDGSSEWAQIGTVGANVTTYVNSGLTPATPYFYRVAAYNTAGDSAYSNVAAGTTAAPPPLSIVKTYDSGGLNRAPLGSVVTYVLTITNHTTGILHNVSITDVLPLAVSFRAWIGYTGSGILPPPGTVKMPSLVVWSPGDLEGSGVLTLAFSVNVTTSAEFAGTTVLNMAYAYADGAPAASGSAAFRIESGQTTIYLPLVIRNWPPTYAISGTVTDNYGSPLAGVVVSDGAGHSVTTDATGVYALAVVAGSYTLTPSKGGYEFTPASRAVTVPPEATGQDFVGAADLQRLVVFEAFLRPTCGFCQAAAQVIREQLMSEYAGQPVLFLEYDVDGGDPRQSRWWDGYAVGGSVYLPLTMVDSGDQIATGDAYSAPGGFYGTFKGMIDAALAVPDGQAVIAATAQRSGNHVTASVQVTNRGGLTLGSANRATVWLLVYEDFDAAPVAGVRLTKQYVRATVSQAISANMAPNASQSFTLNTADLSGVDWNRLHAVVIVDYRPNPSARPYDTYQAVAVPVTQ